MASRNLSLVTGALMGWFAVGSYLRSRRPESSGPQTATPVSSGCAAAQRAREGAPEMQTEAKSSWILVDEDGKQLDGNAHYRVVGNLNMPGSWWSITLYDRHG